MTTSTRHVELTITALALPASVSDIAGRTELRRASWIVDGYLLAYITAMPLAGRLSSLTVRSGLPA